MRVKRQAAICMAAVVSISAMSGVHAMAGSALSIDMTNNNDEAWAGIAMVNDDTVETGVNIRSSQSENANISGYLYRGGAVRVLYKGEEWSEISSGDITGYVKNDYLVYGPEAKGLAEHYGTYGVKASWDDVNVFSAQSGESRIVDTAGDGDTYRLVNRDGDWMTVQAGGGNVAYVPSEDVSVVMVLGGAVSVDGAKEDAAGAAEESFRGIQAAADGGSYTDNSYADASATDASYSESGSGSSDGGYVGDGAYYADDSGTDVSSADASYSDSGYTESGSSDSGYTDSGYSDGSYTESSSADASYSDGGYSDSGYSDSGYSDSGYTDGSSADASYSDNSYTDTSYSDTSGTDNSYTDGSYSDNSYAETVSYTTNVSTSGSYEELSAQASSLYQEYLTAQAAADAAVANGSGEQAIQDTAATAVEAYGRYVTAQNAADAAQWGYSPDTSYSGNSGTDSGSQTTDTSYTESSSYEDTSYTDGSSSEDGSYTDGSSSEDSGSTSTDSGSQAQVSSSDLDLLAALIYCEAGNQPYEGQVAVGAVVMNRVASGSFPNSIREVIYQGGQFTPAYSGALESAIASGAGSGYIDAASAAMGGNDPTGGCLYFNNHRGEGLQIGDHWFY